MCDCYAKPNTERTIQEASENSRQLLQESSQAEKTGARSVCRGVFKSHETWSEYRAKLQARKQLTKEWNRKHTIRPEVNGYIKIDQAHYLGDE